MNRLQKCNQWIIKHSLGRSLLITSLHVTSGNVIDVKSIVWEDYWGRRNPFAEEIYQLKAAWHTLIEGGYAPELRRNYVQAYFALLHTCLDSFYNGQNDFQLLRKIVAFETFCIADEHGNSAAGIFNFRNPVYLLSRIVQPNSPDDPKYLPLICPLSHSLEESILYGHYRRIPILKTNGIPFFVYPPVGANHRPTSYALIGRLFTSLTPKADPWVKVRTRSLFRRVFAPLVVNLPQNRLQLLDLACGSAKISTALCRKAFTKFQKSFDLTLIDVVHVKKSISKVFFRNPSVFGNVIFYRRNIFDWVEQASNHPLTQFDMVMMLRICDVFSSFHIEKMSFLEAKMLLARDGTRSPLVADTLCPAKLINGHKFEKIQHGVKQFRFRNGKIFQQFSLSDYFKAVYLIMGGNLVNEDCMIYVPIRRFDDKALVLPSGRSLIGQLMNMANRIIIEDVDLSSCYVQQHLEKNGLNNLRITEVTGRNGMRSFRMPHSKEGLRVIR